MNSTPGSSCSFDMLEYLMGSSGIGFITCSFLVGFQNPTWVFNKPQPFDCLQLKIIYVLITILVEFTIYIYIHAHTKSQQGKSFRGFEKANYLLVFLIPNLVTYHYTYMNIVLLVNFPVSVRLSFSSSCGVNSLFLLKFQEELQRALSLLHAIIVVTNYKKRKRYYVV